MNNTEQTTEHKNGKFKTKRKYTHFVTSKKSGQVRYHTDTAFLKGEKMSGMLEGVIFKISICDNCTIDFEEIGTQFTDDKMIQRFIDEMDTMEVGHFMKKTVLSEIKFYSEKEETLYLEVEEIKPIDKLANLMDTLQTQAIVNDSVNSILDDLLNDLVIDDVPAEDVKEPIQTNSEEKQHDVIDSSISSNLMAESFEQMNKEKIEELSSRIEKKEKDIVQSKNLIAQYESNLKKHTEELSVLNSRLQSLRPKSEPNGHVFFVSSENKTGVTLDDNLKEVVNKISPLLKLKSDALIDYLTSGSYTIKITKKDDLENKDFKISSEMLEKITKIDILGKFSVSSDSEIEYRGDLTWHKIVDKLINSGFEQSPQFDKLCGSNSYESEEKTDTNDTINLK